MFSAVSKVVPCGREPRLTGGGGAEARYCGGIDDVHSCFVPSGMFPDPNIVACSWTEPQIILGV